jgi:hypothetical protein
MKLLVDERDRQVWMARLERPYSFSSPVPGREFALLLVVGDEGIEPDEQWSLSTQLVDEGCRYAVCCGYACGTWDDAIDMVCVMKEIEGRPTPHVMTSWHDGWPLPDVVDFFISHTSFEDWAARVFLVVVLGGDEELQASVRKAVRACS